MRAWSRAQYLCVVDRAKDWPDIEKLPHLNVLVAQRCGVETLDGLQSSAELFHLLLNHNDLGRAGGGSLRALSEFTSLGVVDVGFNQLQVEDLLSLREIPVINLVVAGNPRIDALPVRRPFLVCFLRNTWCIDGIYVTEDERRRSFELLAEYDVQKLLANKQRSLLSEFVPEVPLAQGLRNSGPRAGWAKRQRICRAAVGPSVLQKPTVGTGSWLIPVDADGRHIEGFEGRPTGQGMPQRQTRLDSRPKASLERSCLFSRATCEAVHARNMDGLKLSYAYVEFERILSMYVNCTDPRRMTLDMLEFIVPCLGTSMSGEDGFPSGARGAEGQSPAGETGQRASWENTASHTIRGLTVQNSHLLSATPLRNWRLSPSALSRLSKLSAQDLSLLFRRLASVRRRIPLADRPFFSQVSRVFFGLGDLAVDYQEVYAGLDAKIAANRSGSPIRREPKPSSGIAERVSVSVYSEAGVDPLPFASQSLQRRLMAGNVLPSLALRDALSIYFGLGSVTALLAEVLGNSLLGRALGYTFLTPGELLEDSKASGSHGQRLQAQGGVSREGRDTRDRPSGQTGQSWPLRPAPTAGSENGGNAETLFSRVSAARSRLLRACDQASADFVAWYDGIGRRFERGRMEAEGWAGGQGDYMGDNVEGRDGSSAVPGPPDGSGAARRAPMSVGALKSISGSTADQGGYRGPDPQIWPPKRVIEYAGLLNQLFREFSNRGRGAPAGPPSPQGVVDHPAPASTGTPRGPGPAVDVLASVGGAAQRTVRMVMQGKISEDRAAREAALEREVTARVSELSAKMRAEKRGLGSRPRRRVEPRRVLSEPQVEPPSLTSQVLGGDFVGNLAIGGGAGTASGEQDPVVEFTFFPGTFYKSKLFVEDPSVLISPGAVRPGKTAMIEAAGAGNPLSFTQDDLTHMVLATGLSSRVQPIRRAPGGVCAPGGPEAPGREGRADGGVDANPGPGAASSASAGVGGGRSAADLTRAPPAPITPASKPTSAEQARQLSADVSRLVSLPFRPWRGSGGRGVVYASRDLLGRARAEEAAQGGATAFSFIEAPVATAGVPAPGPAASRQSARPVVRRPRRKPRGWSVGGLQAESDSEDELGRCYFNPLAESPGAGSGAAVLPAKIFGAPQEVATQDTHPSTADPAAGSLPEQPPGLPRYFDAEELQHAVLLDQAVQKRFREQIYLRAVTQPRARRLFNAAAKEEYRTSSYFSVTDPAFRRDVLTVADREVMGGVFQLSTKPTGAAPSVLSRRRIVPKATDDVERFGLIEHLPKMFSTRQQMVRAASISGMAAGYRRRKLLPRPVDAEVARAPDSRALEENTTAPAGLADSGVVFFTEVEEEKLGASQSGRPVSGGGEQGEEEVIPAAVAPEDRLDSTDLRETGEEPAGEHARREGTPDDTPEEPPSGRRPCPGQAGLLASPGRQGPPDLESPGPSPQGQLFPSAYSAF